MASSPLFRVRRAMKDLNREIARLDDETWEALADEIEDLCESMVGLAARVAQLAGAPDDELERMLRRPWEGE